MLNSKIEKTLLSLMTLLVIGACSNSATPAPKAPASLSIEDKDSKEMKALKITLLKYTDATINNDIPTLVDFIYPKAFEVVSKEKMLTMLEETYAKGNMPTVKDVKHLSIKEIQDYNFGRYSVIVSSMTTLIKSPKPKDSAFEAYMLETLQNKLGTQGEVKFDKEHHLFTIQHQNKTMALNEGEGWKFVGFKQAKKYIDKGIFPLMLIDEIQ